MGQRTGIFIDLMVYFMVIDQCGNKWDTILDHHKIYHILW